MELIDNYKNKLNKMIDNGTKINLNNYYFHVCNINILNSIMKYGILSLRLQRKNKLCKRILSKGNNGTDYISLATTKSKGNDTRTNSSFDEYTRKDISFVIENLNVIKTSPLNIEDLSFFNRLKLNKNSHYSIYYDEVHAKDKIDLNNIVGIMVPIDKDSSSTIIKDQLDKLFIVMETFIKNNKDFFIVNTDGIIFNKEDLNNLKRR